MIYNLILMVIVMNEKICTFFGHRNVEEPIEGVLYDSICRMIEQEKVTTFYVGGHGDFDKLCASVVRIVKRCYPNIRLILVKPQMTAKFDANRYCYTMMYDDVIIPPKSNAAHYKAAIPIRNRWMAAHADVIITYVRRDYGGAYNAVKYAKKLGKPIVAL